MSLYHLGFTYFLSLSALTFARLGRTLCDCVSLTLRVHRDKLYRLDLGARFSSRCLPLYFASSGSSWGPRFGILSSLWLDGAPSVRLLPVHALNSLAQMIYRKIAYTYVLTHGSVYISLCVLYVRIFAFSLYISFLYIGFI